MSVGYAAVAARPVGERVRRTIALLDRRGYAGSPRRLSELCLGGPVAEADVRWAVAADPELAIAEDLVVQRSALGRAGDIRSRSAAHSRESAAYVRLAVEFIRTLVSVAPFITSVSIAGSLASGGVRGTHDVHLNLNLEERHHHLADVNVNGPRILHPRRHRH